MFGSEVVSGAREMTVETRTEISNVWGSGRWKVHDSSPIQFGSSARNLAKHMDAMKLTMHARRDTEHSKIQSPSHRTHTRPMTAQG